MKMGRGSRSGTVRSGALAALLLPLFVAACSADGAVDSVEFEAQGEAELAAEPAPLGRSSQAIQNEVEGVGFEFVRGITVDPTGTGADIVPTLEPTICTNFQGGWVVASRDDKQRYRTLYGFGPIAQYMTNWAIHSANTQSPRLFSTRPACAMRENDSNGRPRFVLAGKSTDNKLYVSTGTLPQASENLDPAFVSADWGAVSSRTYGSGQQDPGPASPVLASHPSSNGGMLLAFISGSTVYAHHHALPYAGSSWRARVAAPPLPNNAIPVGTPAVTFVEGWAQLFHVVVRAQVGSQFKLYETYFGRTANGPNFCGILCGSMAPSWTELPISGTISSSPALEYSPQLGAETIYFRRNDDMVQTSGFATAQQLGTLPLVDVYPTAIKFTGAPAAIAGFQFEMGSHLVVSTFSDGNNKTHIALLESQLDDRLVP
jgi:hypothetical protein